METWKVNFKNENGIRFSTFISAETKYDVLEIFNHRANTYFKNKSKRINLISMFLVE